MKPNLSKFIEGLQKYLEFAPVNEYKENLFELFSLLFTDIPVNQIDFSSFSVRRVQEAVYEIYTCQTMEDEEERETLFNNYLEIFVMAESFLMVKPINLETEGEDFI